MISIKVKISILSILLALTLNAQDNVKDITILHWNDFHAHNLPTKATKKDSAGNTYTYYYGGTSNMLGYLNKYRTSNSLVLNAGDDFQGTPISNFTRGKSQIELLNLYNLDAFVIGNHEFDYGQFALDSALQLSNFDYLSANVYFKSKSSTLGKSWIVKDINGVKIGIIGISPPDLLELSLPKNVSEIVMLNTDSVIQYGINYLKGEKCNLIILLTHEGVENDKLIADKFYKDVDIIVGGHSHTPLFKPVNDKGVIIVQAGSVSRWLGDLDIKVDINKDTVVKYYGKLIETIMDSSIYDKSAEEKVEKMEASIDKEMKKIIGKLENDWKASHNNECNLGQFEADAFREKTGCDISFINGGGLRKSLNIGNITIGDIWEINPFGNEIIKFTVTGKTLKKMMNNNTSIRLRAIQDKSSSEILDCSGINYSFDSRKFPDDTLNLIIAAKVNGSDITDEQLYSISTNNFVTSQFKKFFGEIPENIQFKSTGLIDRDLIIETVEQKKNINTLFENRIIDISKEK